MLSSIKKRSIRLKQSVVKASNISRRWARKHRKKLIIITVVIALIALTIGLILRSYRGVDITNKAVIINHTESKILEGDYFNQVRLIGLNSVFFEVPWRKFILYYQDGPVFDEKYRSPKIVARSSEGTKLLVSSRVSCQVNPKALKQFLEQYGLDWHIYVKQKAKNVIIQKIAETKFYDLNHSLILQKVNSKFASQKSSVVDYPFNFKLIGLKVQYPAGSFSTNNSLGIQLLGEKSLYAQLANSYQRLSSSDMTAISQLGARIGKLQSELKLIELQASSLDYNWFAGLSNLVPVFNGNSESLRRYLWIYFQKVYNSTYNNYTLY